MSHTFPRGNTIGWYATLRRVSHAYIPMWDMTFWTDKWVVFLAPTWDMTPPHMWTSRVTHAYISTWDMTRVACHMCHDSLLCETWLIATCAMTHIYVRHDSGRMSHVSWFIAACDMTHCYVCHDSLLRVPWLIATCVMTHCYMCHDSFSHMGASHVSHTYIPTWNTTLHTYKCELSLCTPTNVGDMTYFTSCVPPMESRVHIGMYGYGRHDLFHVIWNTTLYTYK